MIHRFVRYAGSGETVSVEVTGANVTLQPTVGTSSATIASVSFTAPEGEYTGPQVVGFTDINGLEGVLHVWPNERPTCSNKTFTALEDKSIIMSVC